MTGLTKRNVPKIRFKGFEGEWEALRFRDIVLELSGGASIAPEDYQNDGVRTVPKGAVNSTGIADLSGSKYVSHDFFLRNHSSKVSSGNLITSLRDLVPSAPNMGRIVKIDGRREEFLMPQGVYKIVLHAEVDETFVVAYSNGRKFRKIISSEKNGSTQVHLRNGEFLNIHISTPPHPEQTQIGSYFRELDRLIGLQQRKHDKLVTLKKAMLQKMFPQPGTTTPEIRFKGFEGEWEEKKLGEKAIFLKGKGLPKSSLVRNGAEPCIHYGELFTRYPEIIGEIISRTNSSLDAMRSNANDVLMPTSDVTPRGLAKASCITVDGVILGGDILVIRSDAKRICGSFLSYVIRREEAQVLQFVTGSTVFHLYGSSMKNFIFSMPSVSEQTAIATYFRTLDELISKHALQLEKLKQIKAACLEKMFV